MATFSNQEPMSVAIVPARLWVGLGAARHIERGVVLRVPAELLWMHRYQPGYKGTFEANREIPRLGFSLRVRVERFQQIGLLAKHSCGAGKGRHAGLFRRILVVPIYPLVAKRYTKQRVRLVFLFCPFAPVFQEPLSHQHEGIVFRDCTQEPGKQPGS